MNIFKVKKVKVTELGGGRIWMADAEYTQEIIQLFKDVGVGIDPTINGLVTCVEWPEVYTAGKLSKRVAIDSSERMESYDFAVLSAEGDALIPVFEPGINTGYAMGRYYGFPDCCTHWFKHERMNVELPDEFPLQGTGYVPCPECMKKSESELLAVIEANRKCPVSFPNGDRAANIEFFKFLVHDYQKPGA